MVIFGINLPLRENSGGPQKKLNIGAQLRTFLYRTQWHQICFENNTASCFRYHKLRHSKGWQKTDRQNTN